MFGDQSEATKRLTVKTIKTSIPSLCNRRASAREERCAVHVIRNCVVGVALRDELREAAPGIVAQLQDADIETVILIGDNEHTVRPVADEVGINDYRAELLVLRQPSIGEVGGLFSLTIELERTAIRHNRAVEYIVHILPLVVRIRTSREIYKSRVVGQISF